MPPKLGVTEAISSMISAGVRVGCGYPMRRMRSARTSVSGRIPGSGTTACRTICTRRSVLVNVPVFSAKLNPGRTTSAYLAVSVMNSSMIAKNSRFSMARTMCAVSGSVRTGSSP